MEERGKRYDADQRRADANLAIFITGTGNVPFDPANNRIFVRYKDAGGAT